MARALDPFPVPVRTLDALHLASADFLRQQGQTIRLATYDDRMLRAAAALGFEGYPSNAAPLVTGDRTGDS